MESIEHGFHREDIGVKRNSERGCVCARSVAMDKDSEKNGVRDSDCQECPARRQEELGWLSLCLVLSIALLLAVLTFFVSLSLLRLSGAIDRLAPGYPQSLRSASQVFPYVFPSPSTENGRLSDDSGEARGPSWESLKGAEHCLRYATREYTARLIDIPSDAVRTKVCRETPVTIHGIPLLPDFCQDLGIAGGVWGYWTINFEEPACLTSWGDFIDLGCDDWQRKELLTRRFEAALENMQSGDNWQIMCTTTPADVKGFHFPTPTMCERWGKEGVWGVWEVDDVSCSSSSL